MRAKTIYLVRGTTGEYTDHTQWIAFACTRRRDAEREVVALHRMLGEDGGASSYGQTALKRKMRRVDPNFSLDITGTRYDVVAVRLYGQALLP